jgi:hypothetical protein
MSTNKKSENIYKQIPIELIKTNKDSLEITDEALKLLFSLKNEKLFILTINGMSQSGKTTLANKLISKEKGFDAKKSTKGIWLWGTPINIKNNIKLLIIDCEGIKDNKINNFALLSILFSTHFIYNTKGDLNDNIINKYFSNMNIKDLITFNINNKHNLPEIIFVNDLLKEDEIKNKIKNNKTYINSDIKFFYKNQKYLQTKNIKELINNINNDNNYLDGEIFFGLIQNIINYINHNEKIDIDSALENNLLYKANNIKENIFEEYKNELYKKIEYPMSFSGIYKIFNEIQTNYINSFSQKTDNLLKPVNLGEYINQINNYMEKEINYIMNKNNEYYENYFLLQFQDFKKNLNVEENLEKIENFHKFISDYCGKFDNCLQKFFSLFLNIDNSNKFFVNILLKLYEDFIVTKFIKVSEDINKKYDEEIYKYKEEISSLKSNINKLNEQINILNSSLEEKNKEKSAINKNFFELESKFDKFNREQKLKIKEYENNINIETQKYKKMENYYVTQLKEKEKIINNLENKIEKINQDMQTLNKENTIKINEFNRENNRLLNEIERIKDIKNRNKSDFLGGDKNVNIPSLLKNVHKSFLDFKESVDKLIKENDSIQKNKYLEITRQEIENKLNNVLNDAKNFCNLQIKNVSDNYEKIIKKIKNESEELNFEVSKKNFALNEQMLLKETYEKKFNESNKSIDNLKSMVQDKDNLIKTQNNAFKVYEERINDSEMKMAENIINLKMKEDEFESLFMVFENIVSKRKDKFEHDLKLLSPEAQRYLKALVKQYKLFK